MMHNRILTALATIAIATPLMLAVSCKKDNNNNNNNTPTNATKIVGTWTKTYDAEDLNGNNAIDANEKSTVQAGEFEIATYRSNGTVTDSFKLGGNNFKFDGTYNVTGDYVNYSTLGITESDRLTQLDDHTLILQDTSSHPASWTAYSR